MRDLEKKEINSFELGINLNLERNKALFKGKVMAVLAVGLGLFSSCNSEIKGAEPRHMIEVLDRDSNPVDTIYSTKYVTDAFGAHFDNIETGDKKVEMSIRRLKHTEL